MDRAKGPPNNKAGRNKGTDLSNAKVEINMDEPKLQRRETIGTVQQKRKDLGKVNLFNTEDDPFTALAQKKTTKGGTQKRSDSRRKAKKKYEDSSDSDSDSENSSSSSSSSSSSDSSSDSDSSDSESVEKRGTKRGESKEEAKTSGSTTKRKPPQNSSSSSAQAEPAIKDTDGIVPLRERSQTLPNLTPKSNEKTMQIDALEIMRKGTPFLKYGKRGYPHFRQFQLSPDNSKILWFSKQKKLRDTQISIADIDDVRDGQTTTTFERHRAPELSRSSFSIIYNRRRSSLDLIAKDLNEYKIWVAGLRRLVEMYRSAKAQEVRTLKTLIISANITRNRRSTIELKDYDTGEFADKDSFEMTPRRPKYSGNKQMYKPVAKNFQALRKKLQRKRKRLEARVYVRHPLYNSMQEVVRRVQGSVDRIEDWFSFGEYGQCDDEIWRAGIDLESLSNMMAAVKKT